MRGLHCISIIAASLSLLIGPGAVLAKEIGTERFYESDDAFFFEQPAAGGNVVRFVPHARTEVAYLGTVPTTGGRMAKLWRIDAALDFANIEAAKAEARAAIPAWESLPFVRDVVTTGGCRFLLDEPSVRVVTPPPEGAYEVLGDQICTMEVATRAREAEGALMKLATAGRLVDTGVAPYRVVADIALRADMAAAHRKLAPHREALADVPADLALFMTGYAVAEQLGDLPSSLPVEALEPVFDSMFDALFRRGRGDSYSLREAPSVPFVELEKRHVIAEFSL